MFVARSDNAKHFTRAIMMIVITHVTAVWKTGLRTLQIWMVLTKRTIDFFQNSWKVVDKAVKNEIYFRIFQHWKDGCQNYTEKSQDRYDLIICLCIFDYYFDLVLHSIFSQCDVVLILTHTILMSISVPSDNIWKPEVFWYLQGV